MSVLAVGSPVRYRAWDPTARQVVEPDTTYLMDLDIEETLDPVDGGMIGANEVGGLAADRPYWHGGSKVERASGMHRDGLRSLGGANSFLHRPATGMLAADQWTIECGIKSTTAWGSLPSSVALRFWNDFGQILSLTLNAGTATVRMMHDQDASGPINKTATASGLTFGVGVAASIAFTLLAETMRLYVNGALAATTTDCIPPRFWDDYWANGSGLAVSVETPALTVSDVRVSTLARVPGQVPSP